MKARRRTLPAGRTLLAPLDPAFPLPARSPPALQRSAVAVAHVKEGKGVLRVNGVPLHLVEPEPLRAKVLEPVLLLGADRFNALDVRVRVRGGGFSSQVYGEQPLRSRQRALGGASTRCGNRGRKSVAVLRARGWAGPPLRPATPPRLASPRRSLPQPSVRRSPRPLCRTTRSVSQRPDHLRDRGNRAVLVLVRGAALAVHTATRCPGMTSKY